MHRFRFERTFEHPTDQSSNNRDLMSKVLGLNEIFFSVLLEFPTFWVSFLNIFMGKTNK